MPRDYLIDINISDTIENIVRKSNTNFKRLYHSLKTLADQSIRESSDRLTETIHTTAEGIRDELTNVSNYLSERISDLSNHVDEIEESITSAMVTGIKGDAESSYRRGNVNLTPANIGAAQASHLHDAGNIQSGVLALARGGTGVDASAQYGYKVFGSTNNGLPYFRELIPDEIPTLGTNKVDGIWPVTKGGTGVNSRNTAKNLFFASPYGAAGDPTFRAIHSSDIPQLSPTKSGIQGGSIAVSSVSADSGTDSAITFTPSFNSTPIVIVGMTSSQTAYTGQCSAYAMNVSSSGFTLRRQNNYTGARNIGAYWIAFEI